LSYPFHPYFNASLSELSQVEDSPYELSFLGANFQLLFEATPGPHLSSDRHVAKRWPRTVKVSVFGILTLAFRHRLRAFPALEFVDYSYNVPD
jgi:hypothetical protein